MIPVLAKAVRDIELAVQRDKVRPSTRTTFQVVALLVREERNRVKTDSISEAKRAEQLKRIDAIATNLARTAARDSSLLALLSEDTALLDGATSLMREMQLAAGMEPAPEKVVAPEPASPSARPERQVVPRSIVSR
ncbi:MAG: ATP-dependent helicase, partial [Actinomycetota bacterium]|nr:ATP-dependent helicase [Actinomycetota bacterium]